MAKYWHNVAANGYLMGTFARVLGMPSPQQQSPDRARLVRYIEDYRTHHDLTWTEMAQAGPPPQTLRRVRVTDDPLSRETCERIDNMLDWEPGSTRAVLRGGEPILRPGSFSRRDAVLGTPIGEVAVRVYDDIQSDASAYTPEQRAEVERATAEWIRDEAIRFARAKLWEMEQEKDDAEDA